MFNSYVSLSEGILSWIERGIAWKHDLIKICQPAQKALETWYQTEWGPQTIAKLVYNSNNFGLWYL